MIKAVTKLIIASAGLWLALPPGAQFEIDPDHFGDRVPAVVQPRPEQSKGSKRISLPYKQAQRHRVQRSKGTKSPANTLRTLSSAAAVQHRRVSGASRVAQGPAGRNASEQSPLAPSDQVGTAVPEARRVDGPGNRNAADATSRLCGDRRELGTGHDLDSA